MHRGICRRRGPAVLLAGALFARAAPAALLDLAGAGTARQSSDYTTATGASNAVDGSSFSWSVTLNATDSWWEVELRRPYPMTRVEVVAPSASPYSNVTSGLTLRVEDLRGQALLTSIVTNPGVGGTWGADLPAGAAGRIIRVGLEGGATNGAGTRQLVLAEVRAYGDPAPPQGPMPLGALASVQQSSDAASNTMAAKAVDGDPATYSQTSTNGLDGFWLLTLDQARPIRRVELVNRWDAQAARMAGLILRILDGQSNTVASATVANPGLGGTWAFDAPAGTTGRYVRVGLEGGATNGAGDRAVALAEVSVLSSTNLARGRDAYMVRYTDTLPPATNANDGNYATESRTTTASVDAYWEVDLGQDYALSLVRIVAATGFAARIAHTTLRLYDGAHASVFAKHLTASVGTFDLDVGSVVARYVRVGLENKERTSATGGAEWYLNFKEVQAFGRPAAEVGLLGFAASPTNVVAGGPSTLSWQTAGMYSLDLYPGVGSVGAHTGTSGAGLLPVAPTSSTEYVLVGTNANGTLTRAVTVTVGGQALPVGISEFVADNGVSLEDGYGEASDWIELHNPNNQAVSLAGCGLSDDPALPMKWVFPATNLAAHGYLVVFASGRDTQVDPAGNLHASFQLDADGESVVLTASNGTTRLDAVTNYPSQRKDLAYGRTLDGTNAFLDPTPAAPNLAAAYAGWLAPAAFSHPRGFYSNTFVLAVSQTNAGADLYCGVGGTVPTALYAGPLTVATSQCVRADVRRAGYKSPRIQTQSYIFIERVATASYMTNIYATDPLYSNRLRQGLADLPTVSIAVPVLPDDYLEREASMELFLPGEPEPVHGNCGFFRFGGSYTPFPKKSYRMKFRREYGAPKLRAPLFRGFDHGFLAADQFDEIDLRGGSHDMSQRGFYMSDRFVEDTMLDMGSLNPHGRFVHVYINGVYWGQFSARERLIDSFLADNLGGRTEDYLTVRGNDNVGTSFVPGTPDPPNRYPWERVRALRGSYPQVKPYLDVPNLVDFMLMWLYGFSEAEYRSAGPVDAGSGFKFWIADSDGYLRTQAMNTDYTTNAGPGALFGALVAERHPDFMALLGDRIQMHFFLDGALTPARNETRLNARMREITNSLVAECARWGFQTPASWESKAQEIRTGLFPGRTTNLLGYLKARGFYPTVEPPQLNQYGGSVTSGFTVTIGAPMGTVYYTLDGGDPRLPGGAPAPGAFSTNAGGETLVATGAVWRYWDQGPPPSTNWNQPAFSDAAWPTGRAELGYGDGGEATTIGYGGNPSNRYPAYYFRHTFVAGNPATVTQMVTDLVRDDGAVVYLNGQELFRENMPTGAIQYATWATATVGGTGESTFYPHATAAGALLAGTNVLAVEVHQNTNTSTDISFNLGLRTMRQAMPMSIVLQSNTVLRARVLSGTNWSALIEARYLLAPLRPPSGGELVLSEIHYDPDGVDDQEFVEVYNAGTNLLDLTGVRLMGAAEYLFPHGGYLAPGGLVVVVENRAAFSNRYQAAGSPWYYAGLAVAGEWTGRLGNDGETVTLAASNGASLFSVHYGAEGEWPKRAAGKGSSLELRQPAAVPAPAAERAEFLAQGRNWKSSSRYHGSPGRLDGYVRPVEINECLAHTDADIDWVELRNPGLASVDISGLYLSDRYDLPRRYRLTNGTVVAAGGSLVLTAAQIGFAFSELGSDLLLVEASGTNVIRFVDTVDFAATAREESVGRHVRSDGVVDFTELRAPTKGASNALPRVGPVVFSEIQYRPATGFAEYVELVNLGPTNVPLYDPLRPTNTWQLSGGIAYAFPTGATLAACAPTLVCSTSPEAFRAQYGVDPAIPVYGPWTGSLDNAGESLKLRRPGDPEPDGSVPYYRVDRVLYEPASPWPAVPAGGGISLERITHEGYGNDPGNWLPSAPGGTPGTAVGNRAPVVTIIGDEYVLEGGAVTLQVLAVDADAPWQSATVAPLDAPSGSVFNAATGLFTWTTGEADGPQWHILRFVAADNAACGGVIVTAEVAVGVDEINQPPELEPIADLRHPAGAWFHRALAAHDPDLPAQTLLFWQTGLPPGLLLDPYHGGIEGFPGTPGTYHVVVTVADDQFPSLTDMRAFDFTVGEPFLAQAAGPDAEGRPSFVFPAESNETYDVEHSPAIHPADWQFLLHVEQAPTGPHQVIDTNQPAPPQRFYRVIWRKE